MRLGELLGVISILQARVENNTNVSFCHVVKRTRLERLSKVAYKVPPTGNLITKVQLGHRKNKKKAKLQDICISDERSH